ncbi:hypothetical protein ACQ4LE_005732 [Meloidogyne hapla]
MNKKLFFLTTLSIFVLLFDKGSGKVPLRAKRGEIEPKTNETLPTSTTEKISASNNNNLTTTTEGNNGNENGNELEKGENNLNEEDASTNPTTTELSVHDYYLQDEEILPKNSTDNKTENEFNLENKINETVNFDGKICVLAEEKGLAFKTKNNSELLEYATNGSIKVHENKKEGSVNISMKIMENMSKSTCGTNNYEQFSYCARLKFFGSKGIEIVKNSTLFERNNPKSISEYKKNYMQDMILVLIEGCVLCKNSTNQTITIKFIQLHSKGPIESICPEESENISTLELDLSKYKNGFIVGGIISERLCPSRKSLDDEIEIAPLTYKHKFKIEIEHDCEGEKATYTINFAKELDVNNLTDHVFEMRGLSINLTGNSTEETYDWEEKDEYFIPEKFAELKPTAEAELKTEANNITTEAKNTTEEVTIITEIETAPNGNGYNFIPDGSEFQANEKKGEANEEDKKDEGMQGEENVVGEGVKEEYNETTSKSEEVNTTKAEEIKEEKLNDNEDNEKRTRRMMRKERQKRRWKIKMRKRWKRVRII